MAKMKFIPEVSTKDFTYNSETRTFVTEVSNLRFSPGRIYDDACDIGFYMVSEKTGNKILFIETSPEFDADNELICYNFSGFMDLKVKVFND